MGQGAVSGSTGASVGGGALSGAATGFAVGGPWGAMIGGVAGAIGGLLSKQKKPQLVPLKLKDVTEGQNELLAQRAGLPGVERTVGAANDLANEDYKKRIKGLTPGLLETVDRVGKNSLELLEGKVPGGGTTARDLGLTEFDLEGLGTSGGNYASKMAAALNPSNASVMSTLVSPSAALARLDAQDVRNNKIKNQGAVQSAAASSINPILAGLTSFAGGLGKPSSGSNPFTGASEYVKGLFGPGEIGRG